MPGRIFRYPGHWIMVMALGLTLDAPSVFSAPEVTVKPAIIPKAQPLRKTGPNVLFVIADDLNSWTGWMGGHPQARTPNMDRLAKMGMSFMNAHCNYALCNPSRTALFSGLFPWNSGVSGNEQDWRRSVQMTGRPTLPEWFRQKGCYTAAGGKIFHASHGGPEGKLTGWHGGRRGFEQDSAWDVRFPSAGVQIPDQPVHTGQNYNGLNIWHWDWGAIDVADRDTEDGQVADWAAQFLKRRHDSPFFLAVGLYRPHSPWYVPRKYFADLPLSEIRLPDIKALDLDDVPDFAKGFLKAGFHQKVKDANLWPSAVRAYLASIAFCDAMVGTVLDALEQSPYRDNTIIVFTSDHGWYLGEKQRWHKGGLWEQATRVPLVIVAPNVTHPGTATNQPASLVDLYPTLCELTGLARPPQLDGESLVPLLVNPALPRARPALMAMGGEGDASYSARTDRWRYTRYADGGEELYDHLADPLEWTNLAGVEAHAEVKQELGALLPKAWRPASRTIEQVRVDSSPDGSITYWFQPGDSLDAHSSPDVAERAFDIEIMFDYRPGIDGDSTLLSQGGPQLGYAVHLEGGRPCVTINYDGLRATLKSDEVLQPGQIRLRVLLSLDGSLALSATGLGREVRGFAPFEGGFPRKPAQGLTVAHSFGPLSRELFPNSTPFDGVMNQVRLTLLPGITEERRAARAIPVE